MEVRGERKEEGQKKGREEKRVREEKSERGGGGSGETKRGEGGWIEDEEE